MNDTIGPAIKFGIIGVGLAGLQFLLNWALIAQGFAAWQATLFLYPLFVVISFLANRAWSFGERSRDKGQFLRFALMHLVIYGCVSALVWILEGQGIASPVAAFAGIAFAAVSAFIASHLWVFPRSKAET